MQLTIPFTLLLTSILAASLPALVTATPIDQNAGVISFPLIPNKSQTSSNVHRRMAIRRTIERSRRRYARMTANGTDYSHSSCRESDAARDVLIPPAASSAESLPAVVSDRLGADEPAVSNGSYTLHEERLSIRADTVKRPVEPQIGGTLGLYIIGDDDGYMAKVYIGNPPRSFKVFVDSGLQISGSVRRTARPIYLLLRRTRRIMGLLRLPLIEPDVCGDHQLLGATTSSSYSEDTGSSWSTTYADSGWAAGRLVTDDVRIGRTGPLLLTDHRFGVATTVTQDLANAVQDGVMGLATSAMAKQAGQRNIVDSLYRAGLIRSRIVSFKIPRVADATNDGQITFGGVDPSKFDSSSFVTVPNVSRIGLWEVSIDTVVLNGVTITQRRTAILDTGSNWNMMPPVYAHRIMTALGGVADEDGDLIVPCNSDAQLTMVIGGRPFTMFARDLIEDRPNANGYCPLLILPEAPPPAHQNPNAFTFGAPFLKNAYVSFDAKEYKIGLAYLI
ncbi:hypothetical protein EVG20_g7565 [Dentipellis fragilis]|uniref:Peptidase A1 domain-containing protein n=1 Tax=Dentipellis fragilis TaxID=205917 RepID=A0A4Y9YDF0_9AGAM|nr:hypothetical protein EVG20_g7565 [Dentipellis fragilis]